MYRWISFILLVVFSSCHFASFTERPGVIVQKFPEKMHGTYQSIIKNKGIDDTIKLSVNENGILINDGGVNKTLPASDSIYSISHLGDYYYLNVKESDSSAKSTYYVYPFEFNDKNLYVYVLPYNSKTIKQMKKAGLHISTRIEGEYVMVNENFKNYVEKRLKRKKAIKFNKIK